MDLFNVPKKVNRHVVKAVCFLQGPKKEFVNTDDIAKQVKLQMARTRVKAVHKVDDAIHQSLNNLVDMGLVSKSGTAYSMAFALNHPGFGNGGRALPKSVPNVPGHPTPRNPNKNMLGKRSLGRLNPLKPPTRTLSPDSISGDEQEKARKMFRNPKRLPKKKQDIPSLKRGSKGPDTHKPKDGLSKCLKTSFKAKDRTRKCQPLVCKECRTAVTAFTNAQNSISSGNFPNSSLHELYMDCYQKREDTNEGDGYKNESSVEVLSHLKSGSQHRTVSPMELDFLGQTPNSFMALGGNPERKSSSIDSNSRNPSVITIRSSLYSIRTPEGSDSCVYFGQPSQGSMSAPVETLSFTSARNENCIAQASVAQGAPFSVAGNSNLPMLEYKRSNANATFFNPDGIKTIYGPRSGGSLRVKSSKLAQGLRSSKSMSPPGAKTPKNAKSKFDFYK
ncbi:uncharacterized protein Dana_GF19928 [Drosophila ananassae]|uniref:Uncharacterized protein n=1 Tax=Drosophila ananassae TaxID=7217 RepID=B3M2R8_DROAN|nr:uncharacterized protein LOC6502663 [Drosophila ananassae]EDV42389.2 uncharacterized protein Dana_GF19928 [Drosophila ananassae]